MNPVSGEIIGEINSTSIKIDTKSPTALLEVFPEIGNLDTTFVFSAAKSFDTQHESKDLRVRWDWENDGEWDINYSIRKIRTHKFSTPGTKTIKIEVEDPDGYTEQTTRSIEIFENMNTD